MSLITQCPVCSTMFRIVPDQLRISAGWVRCGQCDKVFDANTQLGALGEAAPSAEAETLWSPLEDSPVFVKTSWQPAPEEPFASQHPGTGHKHSEPLEEGAGDVLHKARVPESREQTASTAPDDAVLSFVPVLQATKGTARGIWRSKPLALLACGALAILLAAQCVFMQRDRLVAMFPFMRPALVASCDVLACALAPLRQIESITIESSSFTDMKNGVYLLQATLKNGADFALAAPTLELTLTDTQDHALLRWVISADEYSGKQRLMSAGTEMAVSFPFSVHSEAATDAIFGYKLLAFYP